MANSDLWRKLKQVLLSKCRLEGLLGLVYSHISRFECSTFATDLQASLATRHPWHSANHNSPFLYCHYNAWFIDPFISHCCSLAWAGRDNKAHPIPTPYCCLVTTHQIRLPKAPYNLASNASRDGASHLLWPNCWVLHHHPSKKISSQSNSEGHHSLQTWSSPGNVLSHK